jgi:hypothetical protein
MKKFIFISHKTSDEPYAKLLVDFFTAWGIKHDEIYCSSVPASGTKEDFKKEIFDALHQSIIDIVLLSDIFFSEGKICNQELGIMWHKNGNEVVCIKLPHFLEGTDLGLVSESHMLRELNEKPDIFHIKEIIKKHYTGELKTDENINNDILEKLLDGYAKIPPQETPSRPSRLFDESKPTIPIEYRFGVADVVGIGALNYDFMFYRDGLVSTTDTEPGAGIERLKGSYDIITSKVIGSKNRGFKCDVRLGGAAFNTIKKLKDLRGNRSVPRLSYVGVSGVIPKEIRATFASHKDYNVSFDIPSEYSFLDVKDWLVETKASSGLGYFEIRNGHRTGDIGQGINKELIPELVKNMSAYSPDRNALAEFLSRAKWIHISSLVEINQFLEFVYLLEKVKEFNSALKVSFDPGSEYMFEHVDKLGEMFCLCDYVFLSKSEYGERDMRNPDEVKALYGGGHRNITTNIIVTLSATEVQWIHLHNGTANSEVISMEEVTTIKNDTGAGGALVAGFIHSELINGGAKNVEHSLREAMKSQAKWMSS